MSDTVIRCVTIPVSVPLGDDPEGRPWTWQTFGERLNGSFRFSTDLANWCVRRLFVLDDPTSKACPDAVKKWYGYKDASENYPGKALWAGAMTSLNLVTRAVQRKYIQHRFDVIVRHDSSLLTYRFPQPYPVHNQNWSVRYEDSFPVVRLNMPGLGRVDLRLKRSAEFGRQLGMIRQMIADPEQRTVKRGEAALYRNRKGDVLLKLVGHFPKRDRGAPTNVAFVHTDPAALLVVEINGRSVKVTNGNHIVRYLRANASQDRKYAARMAQWHPPLLLPPRPPHRGGGPFTGELLAPSVRAHRTFLQRAWEDKKREVRMDRRHRANFDRAVDARCDKQRHRLDTAVEQVAAQVARMCQRQGVGLVAYDDSIQTFVPEGFPWHALKTRLNQLLEGEMGCAWIDGHFTHAETPEAAKERREWLTIERAKATEQLTRTVVRKGSRRGPHPAVTPNPEPRPRKDSPS